jgi:L-iditol 2-dehydrogenase
MALMNAVFMTDIRRMEPGTMEVPKPAIGQVLVKVMHVGVCGSDLHYYESGQSGSGRKITFPFLLGHECAGEIVELGEGVTGLRLGDRVALEPGVTCGQCEFCRSGRYNLCPDVAFFATPPVQGTLCEYVAHPANMCFKLPDSVDTMEGALVEPLAVGFHAARMAQAAPGKTAVILGSGCIGMSTMLALRAHGVGAVYITDLLAKRLARAKSLGADEAIDITKADPVERVMELTHGRGTDIVIDASGDGGAVKSTAELVARAGRIVMVGMATDQVFPYDFGRIMRKEATIKTIYRYRNCYPAAIQAIATGLPASKIVSHRFKFKDTAKAFAENSENRAEIVKAVIEF